MSLHSVRADRLALVTEAHDAIDTALAAAKPLRHEAADRAIHAINDWRDSHADVLYIVIGGIDPTEWDQLLHPEVHTGRKREIISNALSQPLVTIDFCKGE